MSLVASVENGQIVESTSQSSLASSSTSSTSTYDKDTFLQLLVAEVQNQDPLEPSSNTEWISQYATFSELEAMQNMSSAYDLSRASALVGQTVIMKVTDSSGDTSVVQGNVDYVTYEDGEAYLSINGSLYSLDDLYDVIDPDYLEAYENAYNWLVDLEALPTVGNVTLDDQEDIEDLYNTYNDMTEYEQSFISDDDVESMEEYYDRLQELLTEAAAAESADTDSTDTE